MKHKLPLSSSLTCFTTCQRGELDCCKVRRGGLLTSLSPRSARPCFPCQNPSFGRSKSHDRPQRYQAACCSFHTDAILSRVLTIGLGLLSSVLDIARPCVRLFKILAAVAHQRGGRGLGPGSATSRRLGLRPCALSFARVVLGEATIERSGCENLITIDLALAPHTLPSSSFLRRHHLRSIRRPETCAVLWPPQTNLDCAFKDTAFTEWKPCQ